MLRIIAGSARGQTLKVPRSARPTADRVRESLVAILEHRGYVAEADVADLFAGSGAFALECLSRGARSALAVDASREAVGVMAANAAKTGLALETVWSKVESWAGSAAGSFDLIFLDPPYDYEAADLDRLLVRLEPLLVGDGLVVVERDRRSAAPRWPVGFEADEPRTWGDTTVWSARRSGKELG